MDLFEIIERRRSVRKFKGSPVPEKILHRAFEMAVLAPNSSNVQTWDFYRVVSEDKRQKLRLACHNQTPARTASELVVVTVNPTRWKRSISRFVDFLKSKNAPPASLNYYGRTIPFIYNQGRFNLLMPVKKLVVFLIGLWKPINRWPWTKSELYELCAKSAALAAENFVLSIEAQGFQTCMMEGFDEVRVKKTLALKHADHVVMVIAIGLAQPEEPTLPRFRIPIEEVVHEI